MKVLNKHVSSQLVQEFRPVLENDVQKEETVQRTVKLKHNTQSPMLCSDIKANTDFSTLKVEAISKVEGFSYKAWQEKNPAGL